MPMGAAEMNRATAASPAVWLAGDPEDLKPWMIRAAAGIVTNTIVLNDMVKKYGQMTDVIQRYLDITDKKVAVEIDGHSTQELLDVGEVFTKMSDQVILKIPCSVNALGAFAELKNAGVETFCTTVFTVNAITLKYTMRCLPSAPVISGRTIHPAEGLSSDADDASSTAP